jgi:hypothetical protein
MIDPAESREHPSLAILRASQEGYFTVDVVKGKRAIFLALLMAKETIL